MGLTFVPTPLGNLRDMTLRGLDVLREADVVVAEDTRVARRLLSAFDITGKALVRCDEHATAATIAAIIERAREQRVAVVTDAGTPGIADPASALVRAARNAGIAVEMLPGASAFVIAAVLSGFDLERFTFEGFVPRTAKARHAAFERALASGVTTVWYEAPHRVHFSLGQLAQLAPRTPIFLARELTKLYEQHLHGTASEVLAALARPVRGEIVFVIAPVKIDAAEVLPSPALLDRAIDDGLRAHRPVAALAKELSARGYGERRSLYDRIVKRKGARRYHV